jgi:hypothetical protein
MKTLALVTTAAAISVLAGPPPKTTPIPAEKVPVSVGTPAVPPEQQTFVYDQKPISGRPVLISPEQAQSLVNKFKAAYPKLGSPRVAIYVNRELVDEQSGLKLTGRTEKTQQNKTDITSNYKADTNAPAANNGQAIPPASNVTIVGNVGGRNLNYPGSGDVKTSSDKVTTENKYSLKERNHGSLADKQTVRDVERLFGRPLRMAGVNLADQKVAAQLLADLPAKAGQSEAEAARKDREALSKIADVAIEVLISSRNINVSEVSGERAYAVPDIQATAINLKDSKILGQATASDIIGKDRFAANVVRNFDVREIAEATALALMEDMLMGVE